MGKATQTAVFGERIKEQKYRLEILEELVKHLQNEKNHLFSDYDYMFDEEGNKIYETDSEGNTKLNFDDKPIQRYGLYTLTEKNTNPEKWADLKFKEKIYTEVVDALADLL